MTMTSSPTRDRPLDPSIVAGLAVDILGDPSDTRPPLVLLHGLTYDRTMWHPTLAHLRRTDPSRRVFNVDLPGHGQSAGNLAWGTFPALHAVIDAIAEADVDSPVVVGHSLSAGLASIYAAFNPTSGVVNVDSSLAVEHFAAFVQSMADQLRGPEFPEIWANLISGFGIDGLPADAQKLLEATTTPRQDLFLAYQDELLVGAPQRLADLIAITMQSIRGAHVPYLQIAGAEQPPGYEEWMKRMMPASVLTVWPGCGHFPHLALPERFASVLASTATWPTASSLRTPDR